MTTALLAFLTIWLPVALLIWLWRGRRPTLEHKLIACGMVSAEPRSALR